MSEKILSTDYKRGRHNPPKALDLAMPPEELSAPSHCIHQGPLTKARPFFLEEALPVYTLQNLSWDTISLAQLGRGPVTWRSFEPLRYSTVLRDKQAILCSVEMGMESHVHDGPRWYEAAYVDRPHEQSQQL